MTSAPTGENQSICRTDNIDDIIQAMTLNEKVAMLSGSGFYLLHTQHDAWGASPYPAGGGCERLGIPPLQFSDGPRGIIVGRSTCFPCSIARGATFDRVLERKVGEAMGIEARANGCNIIASVCVNVLRHPAWGRAQETYGEDSYHLGEMGKALTEGIQHHNVIATVKHFALNSIENSRFKVDVKVDDRTLYEVYLPQFKKIIDAGCKSVMSAYNKVNGVYCGHNTRLLTEILRDEWGFDGFVHSDWVLGVYSPHAITAGLDIENPEPAWFGDRLVNEVESGVISETIVDRSVRRILQTYFSVVEAADPLTAYPSHLVACDAHRKLALEVAEKSAVLLKNDNLLPLQKAHTNKLAVFGSLADMENTGDQGSSRVNPPYVVSPLAGLEEYLGKDHVIFGGDESDITNVESVASGADAAVVVVGYTALDEGEYIPDDINLGQTQLPESLAKILDEGKSRRQGLSAGGDRQHLGLAPQQVELIQRVSAANPKTIVVVVAGSAVIIDEWIAAPSAILQTFYAGMEGGRALANLLFGEKSPSGKLPFSVAANPSDYPHFDSKADSIDYGYWHGYSLLDREKKTAAFPFGFGLSYTQFSYRNLSATLNGSTSISVAVEVCNTGRYAADEVVQLYISAPGLAAERPHKILRGFERITLQPGESVYATFHLNAEALAWFDAGSHSWKVEAGPYKIMVGSSSREAEHYSVTVEIESPLSVGG